MFKGREMRAFERKAIDAAKEGLFEIDVMEFTADFCRDGGRTINNSEKNDPNISLKRMLEQVPQAHGVFKEQLCIVGQTVGAVARGAGHHRDGAKRRALFFQRAAA